MVWVRLQGGGALFLFDSLLTVVIQIDVSNVQYLHIAVIQI